LLHLSPLVTASLLSHSSSSSSSFRTLPALIHRYRGELQDANHSKDEKIAELTGENTKLKEEVHELKDKNSTLENNLSHLDNKSKSEHEDLTTRIETTKREVIF
jgi:predicted RNase H-like nuclease (RuvC/YqgF family)